MTQVASLVLAILLSGSLADSGGHSQTFDSSFYINLLTDQSTCKITERALNECIQNSFQQNFPSLHNPSKNKDYPTIDPFFFEAGSVNFTSWKTARGSFSVNNMTIIGGKTIKFNNLMTKPSKNGMTITTDILTSKLDVSGWYDSNLVVGAFEFVSKGSFKLAIKDITGQFIIKGNFDRKGEKLQFKSFDLKPVIRSMTFELKGEKKDANIGEFYYWVKIFITSAALRKMF